LTETAREHVALCYDNSQAMGRWQPTKLAAGQALRQPAALFKKLEPEIAEQEMARLLAGSGK
jgi:methionyl-tRNA synthetase